MDDRPRRKPDGSLTRDSEEYAKAWRDLGEIVEGLFPGYQVYGYDPGFVLRPTERNRYDSFSLPIGAVNALISTVEKKK